MIVRVLSDYPQFVITPDGQIQGPSGRWLKPSPNSDGYLLVWFGGREHRQSIKVHVLVCRAYHGDAPSPDLEVRHLNGNSVDNRASNLAWGTRSDNSNDRVRHLRNAWARLTWPQVVEIRERYAAGGVTYAVLAAEYGVSEHTVSRVVLRQTWLVQSEGE